MGTRADFYVGRGPDAEWLGSIAWDGNPAGIDEAVFSAIDEADYRGVVTAFVTAEDGILPAEGWPWPWDDSGTSDYAYARDEGRVYGSSFGCPWFLVDLTAENCGEPDEDGEDGDTAPRATFPDMKARRMAHDQMMAASGLIQIEKRS